MVSQKNMKVIYFTRSRVSIGFSCTILKIQNTCHSQHISPWEVVRARFHEKKVMVISFAYSHARSYVSISFSCIVSKIKNIGHSQCISP
ncbi:hypothetical protein B296_00038523 [Ensete ventricosum]|uniref:Uncharacterized protein n=1 Tax=Ensete ventricosum TaxID=4639 RepID=A0A426Z927_ENSVE|nr:hypothetical protein B296_00038523 [Ensete ventricosum]